MRIHLVLAIATLTIVASCKKEEDPAPAPTGPRLVLKFKFDSTQVRLDELGQPEPLLWPGHAAQSPRFNKMSAHYVEFAPTAWTQVGDGNVVYHAPETNAGGIPAIDFAQSMKAGDGEVFLSVPLSSLSIGTYEYLRVSLAYQNYDIKFRYADTQWGTFDMEGTIASFIGYNTYISSFTVNEQQVAVNDDKPQGFWAFEVIDPIVPTAPFVGQTLPGATTVPNPLSASSPIPAGSCLVTGEFAQPLVITGNETADVVITVSLSTNKSFEWIDNGDDIYEPAAGDLVVDMGVRGLIPIAQ